VPRIIITDVAAQGLERYRLFLSEKNPQAAIPAGQTIKRQFTLLETEPEIGRPVDDLPELRELMIPFGDSGYVALYRHEEITDTVYSIGFPASERSGLLTITLYRLPLVVAVSDIEFTIGCLITGIDLDCVFAGINRFWKPF
jgi:plasmid stabilization system protein ParE